MTKTERALLENLTLAVARLASEIGEGAASCRQDQT